MNPSNISAKGGQDPQKSGGEDPDLPPSTRDAPPPPTVKQKKGAYTWVDVLGIGVVLVILLVLGGWGLLRRLTLPTPTGEGTTVQQGEGRVDQALVDSILVAQEEEYKLQGGERSDQVFCPASELIRASRDPTINRATWNALLARGEEMDLWSLQAPSTLWRNTQHAKKSFRIGMFLAVGVGGPEVGPSPIDQSRRGMYTYMVGQEKVFLPLPYSVIVRLSESSIQAVQTAGIDTSGAQPLANTLFAGGRPQSCALTLRGTGVEEISFAEGLNRALAELERK